MKRLAFLFLLWPSIALGWDDIGINFRSTSGYVTDGTNETYCLGDTGSVTRGGATFGWDSTLSDGASDRSNSIDRRLAGKNGADNSATGPRTFTLTLPQAGQYEIHLALGDATSDPVRTYVEIKDDSTTLATIDKYGTSQNYAEFFDATGTKYSTANWPASETGINLTFATTTLKLLLGYSGGNGTTAARLAHLRVKYLGSGSTFIPNKFNNGLNVGFDGGLR